MSIATFAQTSTAPRRCRIGKWVKRVLAGLLIVIVGLPSLGFIYESIMQAYDGQRYAPFGQILNVDGHKVHLHCTGEGSPTVVIIGGAGALSYQSLGMQQAFSPFARTCIYDRAGYLWSEARPETRTAWQLMSELQALLQTAQIEPSYVLVGASNGGIYARAYQADYPDEVAGMVMVDANSEIDLGDSVRAPTLPFQIMGRIGMFRLFPGIICPEGACDADYRDAIATFRGYWSNLDTYDREIREGLEAPEQIALLKNRLAVPGILGDMPLVILHANQIGVPLDQMDAQTQAYFNEYREFYTSLSSDSRYELVESGHNMAGEHLDVVTEAVRDVVEEAVSS